MANWRVLTDGVGDGNAYQVAFYIPIPSSNNAVGNNYQTCLINSGIGGRTVCTTGNGVGQISAADAASIVAGSLYEFIELYYINPAKTLGQAQSELNARFAVLSNVSGPVLSSLQNKLRFYGATG